MASKPGCTIWLDMIEAMKKPDLPWYYMGKHIEVMNTTGPVMLNYVVKKSNKVYAMLPSKRIMPCSICNLKCNTKNSYLKPLEGSSWIAYDTRVYNFFMCKWRIVVGIILVLLLLLLLFWVFC